MISDETARLLQFIASFDYGMPQNELPDWAGWRDVDDLKKRGFISFSTLVPPNKEKERPHGLCAVHISTAGRDALAAYQRYQDEVRNKESQKAAEDREKKKTKRTALALTFIPLTVTMFMTVFLHFFDEIIAFLRSLFH